MSRPASSARLSSRDRKVLVLGAVIVVTLLLVGRGLPRLRDWARRETEAAAAMSLQVQRLRASLDGRRRNEALTHEVALRLARYDSSALAGRAPTTASARLAELLAECADAAETQLGAVQLSVDSTTSLLGHVSARVEVTGDLEAIAIFLDALEEGPELLAVRELDVASDGSVLPPTQPERLRAQILVEGVYLSGDSLRSAP